MTTNLELSEDSPEAQSWVIDYLRQNEVSVHSMDGFSVRDQKVTALFERRFSSAKVDDWTDRKLEAKLRQSYDEGWLEKISLARVLGVPLFLVIYQQDVEHFRVYVVSEVGSQIMCREVYIFDNCKVLAKWLQPFKGIQVSKRFEEWGRLSLIDRCLRENGVPWPGNLDGFIMDEGLVKVKALFEMARTRKFSVKNHNLSNYYSKDVNRWSPLDILRKQTKAGTTFVIQWHSEETDVKLNTVESLDGGLKWGYSEYLGKDEIVPEIKRLLEM